MTLQYKDCSLTCRDDGCNTGLDDVAALFDQGNDIECYNCMYGRSQSGDVLDGSNEKCSEPDVTGQIDTLSCPTYANAGCYSASTWHAEDSGDIQEDYKGCSTFNFDEPETCSGFELNGAMYNTCKETCSDSSCNNGTHSAIGLSCYSCDVTFDSQNQTVGYGHPSCFSNYPQQSDIMQCGPGETYCVVDIETDWHFYGKQTTRVRRGCSSTPAMRQCLSHTSEDSMFEMKDCSTSCEGNLCNQEMDSTAAMFSVADPQDSCFTCNYIQKDNGDVEGNVFCADEPDQLEDAAVACPMYANAGCYTGTVAHYTDEGVLNEEVHKGCSTFDLAEVDLPDDVGFRTCNNFENVIDNVPQMYGMCKQTCTGTNCNMDHERPCVPSAGDDCSEGGGGGGNSTGFSCYSCDVTFDSQNQTVGYGHPTCFSNEPLESDIVACDEGQTYCIVDIETDWHFYGKQTTRVRRGCSTSPSMRQCFSHTSEDSMFEMKDCSTSCEESLCNKEMDPTAAMFSVPDPQDSCYTCNFIQNDNGEVEGNQFCADEPDKLDNAALPCPMYANAGCYTGTVAHYDDKGVLNEEVHKGCSTFDLAEVSLPDHVGFRSCSNFQNDISGSNQEFGMCKQTCTGTNCNMDHVRPCIPTAGDDCSEDGDGGNGTDPTPPDGGDGAAFSALSLLAALPLYFLL